jgi:hypothetical protein
MNLLEHLKVFFHWTTGTFKVIRRPWNMKSGGNSSGAVKKKRMNENGKVLG